jgi:hypothetical protein
VGDAGAARARSPAGLIAAVTEIADATMTTPSTHLLVFQGWVRCKPDGRANGARRQANMGPAQSASGPGFIRPCGS